MKWLIVWCVFHENLGSITQQQRLYGSRNVSLFVKDQTVIFIERQQFDGHVDLLADE